MKSRYVIALLAAAFFSAPVSARVVEEYFELPVEVKDIHGHAHRHKIMVTVFRDNTRVKAPFLVISHGRGDAEARTSLGRSRYGPNSHYFVSRGFAVFVPTRVGYGVLAGPDVEDSGPCLRREFAPAFEAGAAQVVAVIQYAKTLPFVDPGKGMLVGQSVGGAISLAVSARNLESVLGAINFAGGSGGDPDLRPEEPCSEASLRRVLAGYGAKAKIPTLWLYSENDRYWGKNNPHTWFRAYHAHGARADFVQLPPYGQDGHRSFDHNADAWKPAVEKFLESLGFTK